MIVSVKAVWSVRVGWSPTAVKVMVKFCASGPGLPGPAYRTTVLPPVANVNRLSAL